MYNREQGSPNYIIFYYGKQEIFDNISLRTIYRARTLVDSKGESQIDNFGMSADEMDAFLIFIKQAVNDAFSIVLKMTTGISTQPVFFDETITLNVSGNGQTQKNNQYGFKIVDEAAYNENNLYTVDDGVKKYIEASIMSQWYDLVGHTEEYAKWIAKKDDARQDLITKRLFQLRKPLIS